MALSLIFCTTAYAQGKGKSKAHGENHGQGHGEAHDNKSPKEKAKARSNWMKNKLGIDAAQQQSVYNIFLTSFQQMDKIRKEVQGADKKTQIQQVRTGIENQLKGVLTTSQFAAYLKIKEDRKAKGEREEEDDDDDKGAGKGSTVPNKSSNKKG